MLKRATIIFSFIFLGKCSIGQYYFYNDKYMDNDILFEAGVSLGAMNAVTDVGERKGSALAPSHYDWSVTKPDFGVHCAIMYKSIVEGRLELTKGSVAGKDANSNSNYVKSRNINFKSSIFELSLLGSFHPFVLFDIDYLPAFSPYLIAGIGVFSYYPKTLYKGQWISLRPLNTEGQNTPEFPNRKQYGVRAISVPLGGGIKYELNAKYNLRFEVLYRYTTTDYLDDVSTTYVSKYVLYSDLQRKLAHRYLEIRPTADLTGRNRGNDNIKDNFFTMNFKVGYVIGREKRKLGRTR